MNFLKKTPSGMPKLKTMKEINRDSKKHSATGTQLNKKYGHKSSTKKK
jgi:hypothetical protein